MYNQETSAWRSYPLANPARRPAIDANGKVWAAHYFGNAISKIDPVTGTVTEFELPLKDGNPYDVWPDADDNLWVENGIYNALVRFDQATSTFTYFPVPGAPGAYAEARPRCGRDALVHAARAVGAGRGRAQAERQRAAGRRKRGPVGRSAKRGQAANRGGRPIAAARVGQRAGRPTAAAGR